MRFSCSSILFGTLLSTAAREEQRLNKTQALAVCFTDALSSDVTAVMVNIAPPALQRPLHNSLTTESRVVAASTSWRHGTRGDQLPYRLQDKAARIVRRAKAKLCLFP